MHLIDQPVISKLMPFLMSGVVLMSDVLISDLWFCSFVAPGARHLLLLRNGILLKWPLELEKLG